MGTLPLSPLAQKVKNVTVIESSDYTKEEFWKSVPKELDKLEKYLVERAYIPIRGLERKVILVSPDLLPRAQMKRTLKGVEVLAKAVKDDGTVDLTQPDVRKLVGSLFKVGTGLNGGSGAVGLKSKSSIIVSNGKKSVTSNPTITVLEPTGTTKPEFWQQVPKDMKALGTYLTQRGYEKLDGVDGQI
ncbi:MAG: hypothetical protein EOP06_01670 [Proteobacteria bacterium]|nr:MAG: hypothetical protein EOP06_01670 [Pseudomonadota bacterium]